MGDIRGDLLNDGITFDIQWTQSFQSVVDGGKQHRLRLRWLARLPRSTSTSTRWV